MTKMANETDGMFPPAVTDPFPDHNADQVGAAIRRADHLVRYLIQVWGGVEPELYGPFASDEERDEQAKELFGEEHAVFKMSLEDGVPSVETYSCREVDDLTGEEDHTEQEGDGVPM
jgi:hypothetical protein